MRLSPALKYELSGIKRPVIIFYIVIYALLVLLTIPQLIFKEYYIHTNIGGMDMASMIFLFVVGLNSFKSSFHMLAANGISRRTMFVGFVAATGIICAGMAVIDSINAVILNQFIEYKPMVAQLFESRYVSNGILEYGEAFLWMFFSYVASMMLGFFITTAFYRMNRALKLLVSIGVPVFLLIILSIIDTQLFAGEIFRAIATFVAFCSGRLTESPYVAIASDAVFAIIFGLFGFLLMRRASIKISAG